MEKRSTFKDMLDLLRWLREERYEGKIGCLSMNAELFIVKLSNNKIFLKNIVKFLYILELDGIFELKKND